MALAQKAPVILPLAQERRRHQRVKVNLLGRYMLADRREFPCQVINMSPGGMAVIAPVAGATGERVIAYVDHLGRLEGVIARQIENGFAMTIAATPRKRDSTVPKPRGTTHACRSRPKSPPPTPACAPAKRRSNRHAPTASRATKPRA